MKIEHLYYFLIIAEMSSISKASQKFFISQQHLSRIISSLEKELHCQLFIRKSVGVKLTPCGENFACFAQETITNYRKFQDSLCVLNTCASIVGNCKISFPFFFSLFLNDFIQKFNDIYPNIHVKYYESIQLFSSNEVYASDKLHLILGTTNYDLVDSEQRLSLYLVDQTTAAFCVNRFSSLANKNFLTQKDIDTQLQTTYLQEGWSDVILSDANILFTSSNIYQHLDSVIYNNSICFVPAYIRTGIYKTYPDIVLIPFEYQDIIPIYVAHSSSHTLSIAEKTVVHFLTQYIHSLNYSQQHNLQEF